MKGWVYVITNAAMPNLAKVGYSTQDPELRAQELNHTGAPHPYVVVYDVLVNEPREIERKAHKLLETYREGKEWFRCSYEQAISAIKEASGGKEISENYRQAKREEAEKLLLERARLRQLREQAEAEIGEAQKELTAKYDEYLRANFPEPTFAGYWIGWSLICWILLGVFSTRMSDGAIMIWGAIGGAIAALFHMSHVSKKQKRSQAYQDILAKRAEGMALIRTNKEKKHKLLEPTTETSDFWHPK